MKCRCRKYSLIRLTNLVLQTFEFTLRWCMTVMTAALCTLRIYPATNLNSRYLPLKKIATLTLCFVKDGSSGVSNIKTKEKTIQCSRKQLSSVAKSPIRKSFAKNAEQYIHIIAVLVTTLGFICMIFLAVYYKFTLRMEDEAFPFTDVCGAFASSIAAAIGMEVLSGWIHKVAWHGWLWHIHESHHRPRQGPLEFNDVFAVVNAVPAIALVNFGFFHRGIVPGICFGAGIGMTVLGMAYIFVHNGIVHGRFPVGPVASIPYFRRVAAAHHIHHSKKFNGVPYGLFLGSMELQEVGGSEELEKEINRRIKPLDGS